MAGYIRSAILTAAVISAILAAFLLLPAFLRSGYGADPLAILCLTLAGSCLFAFAAIKRLTDVRLQIGVFLALVVIVGVVGVRLNVRPQTVSQHLATAFGSMSTAKATGEGKVVLDNGPGGHFYADAEIAGQTISFLVDTGATNVTLTARDARRLGLMTDKGAFIRRVMTPAGPTKVAMTTIDHIAIGPISVSNLGAALVVTEEGYSLLGINFLQKMKTVVIAGGTMTLEQ